MGLTKEKMRLSVSCHRAPVTVKIPEYLRRQMKARGCPVFLCVEELPEEQPGSQELREQRVSGVKPEKEREAPPCRAL